MDLFNRAYALLYDRFRALTPGGRFGLGVLAAIALVGAGYLWTHPIATAEVELMRGETLAPGELSTMLAALGRAKLKEYRVEGSSIYVPRGQEAEYLGAIDKAGLLPEKFGAAQRRAVENGSIWDIGTSRDEQRIKIATQTELALSIRRMRGIEDAQVLYDVDKPGGFKEKVVTAVVSVKPAGSAQLTLEQVKTIRFTVAGGISGLKPENVTVTDLNGQRSWHGNLDEIAPQAERLAVPPARTEAPAPVATGEIAGVQPSTSTPSVQGPNGGWLDPTWRMWGLVGLGFVGLLAVRALFRPSPGMRKGEIEVAGSGEGADEAPADESASVVPMPHARRLHEPGPSLRDELSELIDEDPDAAASVLRRWIGQVG
jgi:flagellar biosynthesis/type III secretory pathway M-ring protein FliF/YscJ